MMKRATTQGIGRLKTLRWMVFASAVLLTAMSATPAWADPIGTSQLKISDGTNEVVLTDTNGNGVINFTGTFGSFLVVVSTGVSRPTLGSPSAPHLDLNSIQITGPAGGGSLTISYTDVGFTALEPGLSGFSSMIGGSCTSCSGTFSTYLDSSNAAFGTATSLGSETFGPGSFSSTFKSGNLPSSYPYSLTEVVSITMTGSFQSSSFNAELVANPEPGSLVLLGSGMAGLALLAWRRKKKTTA